MSKFDYTNWRTDMDAAPKGKTVRQVVPTTKGDRELDEFVPDLVILMSECGKVIKSYWLPKENRWAGFSEKSRPLAWQPWPEWSERVADDVRFERELESAA